MFSIVATLLAHLQQFSRSRTVEAPDRCGSFASVWPDRWDLRSTPVNEHSQGGGMSLKGAKRGSN